MKLGQTDKEIAAMMHLFLLAVCHAPFTSLVYIGRKKRSKLVCSCGFTRCTWVVIVLINCSTYNSVSLKEQTMPEMSPRGGVNRRLTLFLIRGLIIAE